MTDADLAGVDARFTPAVRAVLDVRQALEARCGFGATAPARVSEQLDALEERLDETVAWACEMTA